MRHFGIKLGLSASIIALGMGAALAEKTKFEFWYGLSGDLGERVQETCQKFNETQDQYEIVCTSQNGYPETVQNTIAAYRAKKHPAITQIFDVGTLDLMLSGAFVPAHELMANNDFAVNWDDYFGGIANYYATSKGELYSFPYNSSTAMFYYNVDAFNKAGIEKAPETWEDVEAAARKLKDAGYDCPLGFNFDSWAAIEQFSAVHGEPIATKNNGYDGLDAELLINKSRVVDQMTFYKKMMDEGLFAVRTKQLGMDVVPSFASGACQMIQSSIADHGTVGKTAKDGMKWDVTMLPVWAGTERKNSMVGGASLWVMNNRPEEEYKGAAAFLNFIAQPEMVEWWSTVTGYIPVTNSGFQAMKAKGFYDQDGYKGRDGAIESLTYTPTTEITRGIRLGGFAQIRKEIGDGMEAIFTGQATVQEGLDQVAERGNSILRRFEKTYSGKTLP